MVTEEVTVAALVMQVVPEMAVTGVTEVTEVMTGVIGM
jgi:hypothetical protein